MAAREGANEKFMSTETHVFFRGKLPSKAVLARAMKELGFPFSLKPATGSLEDQSGFMPMLLRREETGVELDVYNDRSAVAEFAAAGADPSFDRRASLRWGGDFQEAVAGMCVAAALAKLVNGVVFDEAENKLLSSDDAIALARRNLETLQEPEEMPKLGTRPSDIKRYLKPLLKQRNDLVLLGRLLIIRPVRHLLRGVYFDRTSDKYGFQVLRYVVPLFPVKGGFGYRSSIHPTAWKVWQPYFTDLLFDSLAEDIFDRVTEISTLVDFARKLDVTYLDGQDRFQFTRIAALVLGGERDSAAELVGMLERKDPDNAYWQSLVREQRRFLERDIGSICSEFHAREAEAAQEMKLGAAWEPAPFPVDVPESERIAKCAEPRFLTTPWIPRPPGLIQEAPNQPGEVYFATTDLWRKGRIVLFVPLAREQAEEKHRTHQDYVLATRLRNGILLLLHHQTGWSPHDPEQPRNPDYVPRRQFRLGAYGALWRLQTRFDEDWESRGVVEMGSTSIYDHDSGRELWYASNNLRDGTRSIYDHRHVDEGRISRLFADADIALCRFPLPGFGEFGDFWTRIEEYLEREGFGRIS
jgi:hypothetical protein